jgi:hypothetical protein
MHHPHQPKAVSGHRKAPRHTWPPVTGAGRGGAILYRTILRLPAPGIMEGEN